MELPRDLGQHALAMLKQRDVPGKPHMARLLRRLLWPRLQSELLGDRVGPADQARHLAFAIAPPGHRAAFGADEPVRPECKPGAAPVAAWAPKDSLAPKPAGDFVEQD